MLEYAADDTRHLMRLADWLTAELAEARRLGWALEECRALEAAAGDLPKEAEREDPVLRIQGARHLSPRQLTAIREAMAWRDEIARAKDRATFRVIAEDALIEAVAAHPRTVPELMAIKVQFMLLSQFIIRAESGFDLHADYTFCVENHHQPYKRESMGEPVNFSEHVYKVDLMACIKMHLCIR